MPLRWKTQPAPVVSPLSPEEPQIVLAASGSVTARHRLTQALAAGSLLVVAARPLPGATANTFVVSRDHSHGGGAAGPADRSSRQYPRLTASLVVTNTLDAGPGSLRQAIANANANPGPDVITFDPNVSGTITLSSTLVVTDGVEIQGGPGALAVSGNNANRVFYVRALPTNPFTTTISGLTVEDGVAHSKEFGGGGILDRNANLILDDVTIFSNTAGVSGRGGGVDFESVVTDTAGLTIRNSVITGNQAGRGAGLATYQTSGSVLIQATQILSNSASNRAGGIFFYNLYGHVTVEDSTIRNNSAVNEGGGVDFYHDLGGASVIRRTTITGNRAEAGAGVFLYDVYNPLVIENTTISGNAATRAGGGVYLNQSYSVAIQNSTIVSNTAVNAGGGIFVNIHSPTMPMTDSIVARNTAAADADITGTFQLSYDLVQITGTAHITDTGGNLFGLDPMLNPLADNGGPTLTYLPAADSPAVNAGDPAFAPPPATDQRGRKRQVGRVDIGAVERQTDLFLPTVRR